MSEKIQLHRRGFLAKILQGAAAATVATGTILEVTENKAGATTVKEVETETGEIAFFSPQKWQKWDDLLDKLKTTPADMTDYELFQLMQYMLRSRNATKIMVTYSNLQRNQRALINIHPYVCTVVVMIATNAPGVDKMYENLPRMDNEALLAENKLDTRDLIWSYERNR